MAATTGVAADWFWPKHSVSYRKPRSFVAILNAADYSEKVEALLMDGLRLFRLNVAGRRVLLKPNLVEDLPGPVNTNADIIGAAARCFLRLGAARVVIGEGPGHQRDTELVVQAANLKPHLADRQIQFVDLNRDELVRVKLKANYSGLGGLWLPRTVLDSDFVVSMPKIKTHHWAGVTLSLKNMFGIVPGMKYGWPKNLLHWHGIHESILDICATVPIHFVIADGITAMEGNAARIQTRSYDDNEGVKRYVTEVVADNIVLLGGNGNASVNGANREEKSRSCRGQGKPANGRGDHEFGPEQSGLQDDDVPF